MRSTSFENVEKYEDAVDMHSPTDNHRFVAPQNYQNPGSQQQPMMGFVTPQRPAALNVAPEWRNSMPRSRNNQSGFNTPRPSSTLFNTPGPNSVRDSAHRDRLVTLRHRMNKEFGNREFVGSSSGHDYEIEETMSSMSEAPSLQSWQHRMIHKNETVVVNAADSMSTCAISLPRGSADPFTQTSSPQSQMSPGHNTSFGSDDRRRSQTWAGADQSSPGSSISPCPRVPPPIPSRAPVTSPTFPPPVRMPPPLPPRTPSMRLPDPISMEVESRLEEECKKKNGLSSKCPTIPEACEAHATSSKSIDSIASRKESIKSHKKSNSLDRGVTLEKKMKHGPFPPLLAKSNSLSRKDVDEDELNALAENVVKQITSDAESNHSLNRLAKEQQEASLPSSPKKNGTMTAASSSASSSSSDVSQEKIYVKINNIENEEPCSSRTYVSQESAISLSPAKTIVNRCSRSLSNDELRSRSERLSSSFDPITLDVERRLSMKRSGQTQDDDHVSTSLSDDNASRVSVARSGITHAASFARSSVRLASGMLRGAFRKVRNATHPRAITARAAIGEETSDGEESDSTHPTVTNIVRPRKNKKGPFDFEHLTVEQELDNEHTGAVWCIKFSICGRLMATAGQDSILRVWVVRSHLKYFSEMRDKYSSSQDPSDPIDNIDQYRPPSSMESVVNSDTLSDEDSSSLFCVKPFAVLKGHTADILDLSWSKNYFILSSGMDRTVKLWHLSRNECLCCFQHVDFVTCVAFLPKDDRYFLSGSLDGKLRMWHIPDKKVAVWNEVAVKFITAMTFVKSGKFAVVGTYDGQCFFYTTDQLKYHTVVNVRSSRGKNAKGHKITGLAAHGDKLLVTSNDSRIRMYDIRDKALTCKFRGVQNDHSQIRAAFSPDGRHIICGSEDKFVYVWRACDMPVSLSVRKDRNSWWERIRAHQASVSVAVFAPRPQVFFSMLDKRDRKSKSETMDYSLGQSDSITSNGNISIPGHAIVSADLNGVIKVMVNKPRVCKIAPSDKTKPSGSIS